MKVFNIKFSQTIAKIIAMMNNAGCKNKSGWLIKKNMKLPKFIVALVFYL